VDTDPGPEPGDAAPEPVGGLDGAGARAEVPAPVEGRLPDGLPDGTVDGDEDRAGDGDDPGAGDPLRFHRWMKRSATGAVLSGIALGLQQALEGRREQPAFVMEAPGEPEDPDAPITLHFDPDDPTRTVAVVRAPTPAADTPDPGR